MDAPRKGSEGGIGSDEKPGGGLEVVTVGQKPAGRGSSQRPSRWGRKWMRANSGPKGEVSAALANTKQKERISTRRTGAAFLQELPVPEHQGMHDIHNPRGRPGSPATRATQRAHSRPLALEPPDPCCRSASDRRLGSGGPTERARSPCKDQRPTRRPRPPLPETPGVHVGKAPAEASHRWNRSTDPAQSAKSLHNRIRTWIPNT